MGVMNRRRGFGAVSSLLVVGAVGVTSFSASGQSTASTTPPEATEPVPLVPYGTLTITLNDRSGTYRWVDPQGQVVALETPNPETIVTGSPCAAVQPGSGKMLRLTPNPASPTSASDTVQLRDGALGVNTGNTSCGTSNAAVISRTEQLEIELGEALPEGVQIKSASLQIKKLKSGNLKYALDGGTLSAPITISQSLQQVLVAPTINSDQDYFTRIALQSTSTRDNEGLSVSGASFELVGPSGFDVAVECGQQVTKLGGGGDIATNVVYFRGENASKSDDTETDPDPCVDVGVIVEIQKQGEGVAEDWVFWDNSAVGVDGTPQAVNGTVTIEWAPIPPEFAHEPTQIDFDGPDGPDGFVDAPWCLSFLSETTVVGDVTKVTFTVEQPEYDGLAANPDGTAPWCLVSSDQVLDGDGGVHRVETFFGSGDPTTKTLR
jgi:hypothetical protein